jgi:GAF domain-containing protein
MDSALRKFQSKFMMMDDLAAQTVLEGDDDGIRAILAEVCTLTDMGFAAVARVTDSRWIACQVLDKIEFGLTPGSELKIQTTICSEIREHGQAVIFDDASLDFEWRTHPVPILYGFKSYASFPILLPNGEFYGTLCAIDPAPRKIAAPNVVAALRDCVDRVAAILGAEREDLKPD